MQFTWAAYSSTTRIEPLDFGQEKEQHLDNWSLLDNHDRLRQATSHILSKGKSSPHPERGNSSRVLETDIERHTDCCSREHCVNRQDKRTVGCERASITRTPSRITRRSPSLFDFSPTYQHRRPLLHVNTFFLDDASTSLLSVYNFVLAHCSMHLLPFSILISCRLLFNFSLNPTTTVNARETGLSCPNPKPSLDAPETETPRPFSFACLRFLLVGR